MSQADRWLRVRAIFDDVVGLAAAERAANLAARCGDDEALMAEVRSLLDADEAAGAALGAAVASAAEAIVEPMGSTTEPGSATTRASTGARTPRPSPPCPWRRSRRSGPGEPSSWRWQSGCWG